MSVNDGALYIISTPIGNLQDITLRALETLKKVDYIACEDTRVTLKLLNRYGIKKTLISFHSKSNRDTLKRIQKIIAGGYDVAYVTDSGTPLVSDPGGTLVQRIVDDGLNVVPVPGPSAVHAALVASGLRFSEYTFIGFISNKSARRRKKFAGLGGGVFIFYESPHRVTDFLSDASDVLGDIPCAVSREITKKFETHYRGSIYEVMEQIRTEGARGEYTVILDTRNRREETS
jgi:16S rRNA (cytidine1402-2'-O)-methyltransferase